jgi:predicted ATPase/DNA-binding SARP family transcriptional activator/tetratricopeptide (TPR) repeat protein
MGIELRGYLLGGADYHVDGELIGEYTSQRAAALLAYLMLEPGLHGREFLAQLLWEDRDQDRTLSNLRSLLAALPDDLRSTLTVTRSNVGIDPTVSTWTDFEALRRQLTEADDAADLEQALAGSPAEFLGGLRLRECRDLIEWIELRREGFRLMLAGANEKLAREYLARREPDRAVIFASTLLELEPLRENFHRLLMRALALAGRHDQALEQYEHCRSALERHFSIDPDRKTRQLARLIRLASRRHMAEPAADRIGFIGRAREIQDVDALLDRESTSLVTLAGPGGIGKSRLAFEIAHSRQSTYLSGAEIIELAVVRRAEDLPVALSAHFDLSMKGGALPIAQIVQELEGREMLLVLDNIEHLLPDARSTIEALTQLAGCQVLVTSRERLNLAEEQVYRVYGLGEHAADEDLGSSVDLFLAAARRRNPEFAPNDEAMRAVEAICAHLEGMPLGIELAAAWADQLTTAQILAEIEADVGFLKTRRDEQPERHDSLAAIFDHAVRRLNTTARQVLQSLTVFRGRFDFGAARAICEADPAVMRVLVDRSLVIQAARPGVFQIQSLLREYLFDRWKDPAAVQHILHRHRGYFGDWLAAREQPLELPFDADQLREVNERSADIELAFDTTMGSQPTEPADVQKFLNGLNHYYHRTGWYLRGLERLGAFRAWIENAPGGSDDDWTLLRARSQSYEGGYLAYLGKYPESRRRLEASFEAGKDLFTQQESARILISLSQARLLTGAFELALESALEAARLFEALQDSRGLALALRRQAGVEEHRGHLDSAEALLRKALQGAESVDDQKLIASINTSLGNITADKSQNDIARRHYDLSRSYHEQHNNQYSLAVVLNNLGTIENALGDYASARVYLRAAIEISEEIGDEAGVAIAWGNMGTSKFESGDYDQALLEFRRSLRLVRELDSPYYLTLSLGGVGHALAKLGRLDEARLHLDEAMELAVEHDLVQRQLFALLGYALVQSGQGDPEAAYLLLRQMLETGSGVADLDRQVAKVMAEVAATLGEAKQQELDQAPLEISLPGYINAVRSL